MENTEQSKNKAEENKEFLIPSVEKSYQRYFNQITELQAGDIIVHGKCKLCNHPLRSEAEAKWEQTKSNGGRGNYTSVIKFLHNHPKAKEYGDIKFNHQNLALHLNKHYEQQIKRMWLREYGRDLAKIINYKISKEEMFEGIIQSLQLKLFEIASNPDIEIVKQCSIMNGLTKSILDASVIQAKLRGDIDTVEIYKEKFQNIMINIIADKSEEEQQEYMNKLDVIRSSL